MYPRLSDLIQDLFGIYLPLPIQTYGFMMATAFVIGAWIAYIEIKRYEKEGKFLPFYQIIKIGEPPKIGELILNFIIWTLIGFKLAFIITNYEKFSQNPQYYLFSKDGDWTVGILLGLVVTGLTFYDKYKKRLPKPETIAKKTYPHELIGNLIVIGGIWGLIGAKLFHILAHIKDEFLVDPIGSIFSFGGLAFYGGFIFGFVAIMLYIRKYNINLIYAADIAALVLSISYAVGRIGCQLSGDGCWGIVNTAPKPKWLSFLPDWAWAFDYPHNVIREGVPIPGCEGPYCFKLAQPVFPTPLYETTIMFLVFIFLWSIRKKVKMPGVLFSLYLILAGLERFFIEYIRITPRYEFLGIKATQAQIISVIMIIAGIIGLILIYKYPDKIKKLAEVKPKPINHPPKGLKVVEDIDQYLKSIKNK